MLFAKRLQLPGLFIICYFFCNTSFAQSEHNNLVGLLKIYLDAGEYKEGLSIAEKTVVAAKKEFGESHPLYATSLNNLGVFYLRLSQYKKADTLFTISTALRKKILGENHPDYATSLNNLAALYADMGDYKRAEPLHLQAISIDKKTLGENHPQYAQNLHNLAHVYENLGQYKKAEPLFITAMEIRKKILGQESREYAESLSKLSGFYRKLAQYSKAEALVLQSVSITKKILGEEHPSYTSALNNLGHLYNEMGEYNKAEQLFSQSLQITKQKQGENTYQYAINLENLGLLYGRTGEYSKAESVMMESLSIQKKIYGEGNPEIAGGVNNLAFLYFSIGQYEKAETLFKESLSLRKISPGENHPDYAQSLNNLAILYLYMEQYNRSEPLLLHSIALIKKILGTEHPHYVQGQNSLAGLYINRDEYKKAEPLLQEVLTISKKISGESHPDYARALNNLAALYYFDEQYANAEKPLIESMTIRKMVLGEAHPDYVQTLYNLSLLYDKIGMYAKAEPYILKNSKAEMQNLATVFNILSEKEKGNYLLNNTMLIESNNRHVFRYGNASPAVLQNNFDQQLFFKSVALSNTKNTIDNLRKNNDTATKRIFENWRTNKAAIAKEYSLPAGNRNAELKKLEEETERLEKELNRKSISFRTEKQELQIKTKEVAKSLKQGEVAIEFVRFNVDNKKWTDSVMYAAYILNKTDSVPVFVPLCEEKQLQKLFDSAGTTATAMVSSFYRGLELNNKNAAGALGAQLYKLVWQPIEPYLKKVNKINYSPAGKLYSIAFHALPTDSTTVLMDKYQLQQYTSTRQVVLTEQENQNSKPKDIALFGDASFTIDSLLLVKQNTNQPDKENIATSIYTPKKRSSDNNNWSNLPGTAEEVNKIKQLFDGNKITTKTLTQTAASEENLKALSGNSPQILHIATHGFFLPEPNKKKKENNFNHENTYTLADDPLLRSGLILAGGNYVWGGNTPIEAVEDGIATAYEISQLNLSNTELVVLSACETALGDVKGSEGVFGLQRAFKMAGVKKMIVSLWQVPDKETAELMTSFYTYWMKGKTINDAFAQAQADMRKKYSPFYWAAFVLVE